MSVRVIGHESYRAMPWKNGGGTTQEIARSGEGESPEWRISLATIDQSGPFSDFAGYDRTIVPVQGTFALQFGDGRRVELAPGGDPLPFAGEDRIECVLENGPSRDLNVMTQRTGWTHAVSRRTLEWDELVLPPGQTFVYVISGDLEAYGAHGEAMDLRRGDTLQCSEFAETSVLAHDTAELLIVELRPQGE